ERVHCLHAGWVVLLCFLCRVRCACVLHLFFCVLFALTNEHTTRHDTPLHTGSRVHSSSLSNRNFVCIRLECLCRFVLFGRVFAFPSNEFDCRNERFQRERKSENVN